MTPIKLPNGYHLMPTQLVGWKYTDGDAARPGPAPARPQDYNPIEHGGRPATPAKLEVMTTSQAHTIIFDGLDAEEALKALKQTF